MFAGAFIKEHAEAIAPYVNLKVAHLTYGKGRFPRILIQKQNHQDYIFYKIHVKTPLRRFGCLEFLIKSAYKKVYHKVNSEQTIDIVHINVGDYNTRLLTQVIKDKPIVLSEHFSFYHTGIKQLPKKLRKVTYKRISAWFKNENIKTILPVSHQLGQVLIKDFGVNPDKIVPIPNVASKEFYYQPKIFDGKIRLLLVAKWQYPKNPVLFLKALKIIDDKLVSGIEINWVGDGSQMNEILVYHKEHIQDIKINFLGFQPKAVVADLMRRSDIFIHPTDAENLPTVIIESLVCGTPVLSNNVNGIPELINKSNGILCNKGDEICFAKSLQKMIENIKHYNFKEIAGESKKKFTSDSIGNQIFKIYNEISEK
ncbi:MAG: glycosyltransferase family 4 protein [Bacteroidales bacterium]|nr:glycosyltransferase family 4 protein [Bacteroidales bacterium]